MIWLARFVPAMLMPLLACTVHAASAEEAPAADAQAAELAKQLQNPIASLISVPLQSNWDTGIGPEDAMRYTLNVQPVVPLSIGKDWNLIVRTIMPIIDAESPVAGGEDSSGLGDILQSFFFSPKAPVGGWIVGGGSALLYPTASENELGGEQWAAGPTAVALQQRNGWTYGALANHLWSFAGEESRADISATFLQPFLSYTTKTQTTWGGNSESTFNWENDQWTVPFNLTVSQLLKLGKQPVSLQLGGRYYAEKPDGGPDWGLRFTVTLLFPK